MQFQTLYPDLGVGVHFIFLNSVHRGSASRYPNALGPGRSRALQESRAEEKRVWAGIFYLFFLEMKQLCSEPEQMGWGVHIN